MSYESLPLSKRTRVFLEAVRTAAAVCSATTTMLVALKVFHII